MCLNHVPEHSIDLNQLSRFRLPTIHSCPTQHMVSQLELILDDSLNGAVHYVTLPSISVMAEFFGCSSLQVYDGLHELRKRGYDYQFASLDGAVEMWRYVSAKP
ncbi:MAG: hypothetical protein AB7P76_08550 [Candidatus Melainabacteria bacterium]